MLKDDKQEVNLNFFTTSNFSDRKIDPQADKLGPHNPLLTP